MPTEKTIHAAKAFRQEEQETLTSALWSIPAERSALTVRHVIVCIIQIINAMRNMSILQEKEHANAGRQPAGHSGNRIESRKMENTAHGEGPYFSMPEYPIRKTVYPAAASTLPVSQRSEKRNIFVQDCCCGDFAQTEQ